MLPAWLSRPFSLTLALIILGEALSFLGYLWPWVNYWSLAVLAVLVLLLCLADLRYGLALLLVELLIGSQGYLFYFNVDGTKFSLRLVLWLIVLGVWFWQKIQSSWRAKKIVCPLAQSRYRYYWLAWLAIVAYGIIWGLVQGNGYSNIFLDANNWLYLLLLFPLYDYLLALPAARLKMVNLGAVATAAVAWLVVKTYFLLYFLSHNFGQANYAVYRWVRETGIGEVTMTDSGFFRLFFQSHIFIALAMFIAWLFLARSLQQSDRQSARQWWWRSGALLSVVLLGLSRSFWLGCLAGGAALLFVLLAWLKLSGRRFLVFVSLGLLGLLAGALLIFATIRLPLPEPIADFSALTLLDRGKVGSEAAATSRWTLLPLVWEKIKAGPILGHGLGATITYRSSDPRIVQQTDRKSVV